MTGENGHHQGKAVTAETRFFCVHCKQLFTSQFDKNMHEMEHSGLFYCTNSKNSDTQKIAVIILKIEQFGFT